MFDIIIQYLSVLVGIIFLKSSFGKIKNPFAFQKVLSGYHQGFSKKILILPILLLGPLELLIGVTLILRVESFLIYMVFASIALQLLFLIMMMTNYNRVLPFGCGCFGLHTPEKITLKKVIFNLSVFMSGILIATNL